MFVVLITLLVALAALLAFAANRPSHFRVERSTVVQASPEQVFEHLESFARWSAWSPWEKLDPAMKRQYSGPERGIGAAYHWVGNKQVGEGKMEITGVKPAEQLLVKLDFIKPFAAHNTAEFTVKPVAAEAANGVACQVVGPKRGGVQGPIPCAARQAQIRLFALFAPPPTQGSGGHRCTS